MSLFGVVVVAHGRPDRYSITKFYPNSEEARL